LIIRTAKEFAMLWNTSVINGHNISASDGHIGTISDFLFDDANWPVRWLVIKTGHWLSGRKILLPSIALAHLDKENEDFSINLTLPQIRDSPVVDTEQPISRQKEASVYSYYGYSPYWDYGYLGDLGFMHRPAYIGERAGAMRASPGSRVEAFTADAKKCHKDVHLHSVKAVTDYNVHAIDGQIGHVDDFLLQDTDWNICYLVVDTKNWSPAKKVLISPHSVKEIDWSCRLVNVDVDRQTVKGAPEYDDSIAINRTYEDEFRDYYGIRPIDA
jgi:hypothetical protein